MVITLTFTQDRDVMTRYTFGDLRSALSDPPNITIVLEILEKGTREGIPYHTLEEYVCESLGYLPIGYWKDPLLEGVDLGFPHAIAIKGDSAIPCTQIGPVLRQYPEITSLQDALERAFIPLRTEMFEQHWLVWVATQPPDERERLNSLTHHLKGCITNPLNRSFVYNLAREHAFLAGWSSASAAISCICATTHLATLKAAVNALLWDDPNRYEPFHENKKTSEVAYMIDKVLMTS